MSEILTQPAVEILLLSLITVLALWAMHVQGLRKQIADKRNEIARQEDQVVQLQAERTAMRGDVLLADEALRHTSCALVACDKKGRLLLANEAAEALLHLDVQSTNLLAPEWLNHFRSELVSDVAGQEALLPHMQVLNGNGQAASSSALVQDKARSGWIEIYACPPRRGCQVPASVFLQAHDVTEQIQRQLELGKEIARWQELINDLPALVWISDADFGLLMASKEWESVLGQKSETMLGQAWLELVHPVDLPDLKQQWREAARTRTSLDLQLRLRNAEGDWRWFRMTGHPQGEPGKGFTGFVGCCLGSEVAGQGADELGMYRIIADGLGEAMLIIDEEGFILHANRMTERLYGCSREQLIGTKVQELRVDNTGPSLSDIATTAGAEGLLYEVRHKRLNGAVFTAEVRSNVIELGGKQFFIAFVRDVGPRRAAQEELREERERFHAALQSAGNPTSLLENHQLRFVNQAMTDCFGQYKGQPCYSYLLGSAKPCAGCRTDNPACEQASANGVWASPDQSRWYKASVTRLHVSAGTAEFLLVLHDVTKAREDEEAWRLTNEALEARVNERTVQLQEANKELESFAYSVSHDLRAPLRTLNGFSKILLRQPDESLSDQTVHYLELINKSALRMDQLVSGLLEYSRTGRAAMHPDWVAPDGIVQELMEELGMQYPTATILAEALPRCWADRQLLRQVLQNLLGNALKFSSKRSDAVIQVGAKRNGEEVIYFVRDNGEGFDPTYSDRLFRVFQRLHTEEDYEGTGIGLAIVGSIITRHGGRVWAESKPNEGATFFFTLPGGEHNG